MQQENGGKAHQVTERFCRPSKGRLRHGGVVASGAQSCCCCCCSLQVMAACLGGSSRPLDVTRSANYVCNKWRLVTSRELGCLCDLTVVRIFPELGRTERSPVAYPALPSAQFWKCRISPPYRWQSVAQPQFACGLIDIIKLIDIVNSRYSDRIS